jgi:hypothetical protein
MGPAAGAAAARLRRCSSYASTKWCMPATIQRRPHALLDCAQSLAPARINAKPTAYQGSSTSISVITARGRTINAHEAPPPTAVRRSWGP